MSPKEKRKEQLRTEEKKRKVSAPGKATAPAAQEERKWLADATAAWSEEIQKFHGERFASVQEATEVLVSRIVDRLSDGAGNAGMSQFLLNFLETDPEIQRVLERYVK